MNNPRAGIESILCKTRGVIYGQAGSTEAYVSTTTTKNKIHINKMLCDIYLQICCFPGVLEQHQDWQQMCVDESVASLFIHIIINKLFM